MQEFFRLVYAQNLNMMFLIIILAVILWAFVASIMRENKKLLWTIFNILILLVIFAITIHQTVISRKVVHTEIELFPFKQFFVSNDLKALIRSFFMNCLLFVPLGLSMPYVLSKKPNKRNVFVTIGFAAVLSAVIEFLQYYYHLGRCETDDVIANTLGAAVGAVSYLLYIRILKNRKESLMNSKISDSQKLLTSLCSKALFNKECDLPEDFDCDELIDESIRQTVFPQIFSSIKEKAAPNVDKLFSRIIAKNIRVEYGHNEVHKVLSDNNIPYVVLKGVASASHYNEPTLRMMGDIDILVAPDNIAAADNALNSIGFITDSELESDHKHIAYKRRDGLICELHRSINGIPATDTGVLIEECFSNVFVNAIEHKTSNGRCAVPSKFHHGVILLLHTATHLTSEGVGLRHLCDWAVFANSFSNDEFVSLFEKSLKEFGFWRFAQLLTLCCIKCLGCDAKAWAGEASDELIDSIMVDILNGGNFGVNDLERYSQIKYISDREIGAVAQKNAFVQLLCSINAKSKNEFPFVKKSVVFLPVGWLFTICKHLYLIIIGKRYIDGVSIITNAKKRKDIYDEFRLFEK